MPTFYTSLPSMCSARTMEDIELRLKVADFREQEDSVPRRIRMLGILFAKPNSEITKSSIFPNLEYFHHRSGTNIDIFMAGYRLSPQNNSSDTMKEASLTKQQVTFDEREFVGILENFENKLCWHYSGGVDLLLTNYSVDPDSESVNIDFSSSIVCKLNQMIADGAIQSVDEFFERIFQFAKNAPSNDPTWGFSENQGARTIRSAITRVVLSLLPKKLGDDVKRASYFAVSDLTKSA